MDVSVVDAHVQCDPSPCRHMTSIGRGHHRLPRRDARQQRLGSCRIKLGEDVIEQQRRYQRRPGADLRMHFKWWLGVAKVYGEFVIAPSIIQEVSKPGDPMTDMY